MTKPAWLRKDTTRDAADLLRPHSSEAMRAYRVSTAVNSAKNDGAECGDAVAASGAASWP